MTEAQHIPGLEEYYAQQGFLSIGSFQPFQIGSILDNKIWLDDKEQMSSSRWKIAAVSSLEELTKQSADLNFPQSYRYFPFFYRIVALD